jgi:hypothetical protein
MRVVEVAMGDQTKQSTSFVDGGLERISDPTELLRS